MNRVKLFQEAWMVGRLTSKEETVYKVFNISSIDSSIKNWAKKGYKLEYLRTLPFLKKEEAAKTANYLNNRKQYEACKRMLNDIFSEEDN